MRAETKRIGTQRRHRFLRFRRDVLGKSGEKKVVFPKIFLDETKGSRAVGMSDERKVSCRYYRSCGAVYTVPFFVASIY